MAIKTGDESVFAVAERGWLCVPCPLVSRDRASTVSSGAGSGVLRGTRLQSATGPRAAWRSGGDGGAWIEAHVGVGPARVLVRLEAPAGERLPERYRLETCSRGRDGQSGWRQELTVVESAARTRAHVIEFDGQNIVRVLFDGPAALERLDVHDASDGTDDVWLVLGDELASAAFGEAGGELGFAERVHALYPGYFPAVIDESRPGERVASLLGRLGSLLDRHADAQRVAVAFGASLQRADDIDALDALAAALLGAGRVPLLARAPLVDAVRAAEVEAYNARVGALELQLGLARGPEPMWSDAGAGVGARAAGARATGALLAPGSETREALIASWVNAAEVFYVPQ